MEDLVVDSGPFLNAGEILRLKRFTTPTVYNGWEQISRQDRRTVVNREDVRDFMPQFGPMVGYAVTLVVQPSRPEHIENDPDAPARYREYVESLPGPKILVLQDLDAPNVIGTYVGEVNSSLHRALGCVGIITDGGVRDIDEMASIGFRAIASRLCVGHAYAWPVRWGCDVEVFGCTIKSGNSSTPTNTASLPSPTRTRRRCSRRRSSWTATSATPLSSPARFSGAKIPPRSAPASWRRKSGSALRPDNASTGKVSGPPHKRPPLS